MQLTLVYYIFRILNKISLETKWVSDLWSKFSKLSFQRQIVLIQKIFKNKNKNTNLKLLPPFPANQALLSIFIILYISGRKIILFGFTEWSKIHRRHFKYIYHLMSLNSFCGRAPSWPRAMSCTRARKFLHIYFKH